MSEPRRRWLADLEQMAQIAARVALRRSAARSRRRSARLGVACCALRIWKRPVDVSAVPWRASRVGRTQSNMSTPAGDRSRRCRSGRRRPSGSAGGRRAARRAWRRAPRSISGRGLADRQPADAVAVEVERDGAPRGFAAQIADRRRPARCRTAPDPRARCGARARSAHIAVRSTASGSTSARRRQRRAHVEHHLDVGADRRLRARPRSRA